VALTAHHLTNTDKQNNTGKSRLTNSIQIRKSRQPKIQRQKTSLVQLPLTTLGQETRWAYSTTLPSPHGAPTIKKHNWGQVHAGRQRVSYPVDDDISGRLVGTVDLEHLLRGDVPTTTADQRARTRGVFRSAADQ